MNFIRALILRFKQEKCNHKFNIRHLEMVNQDGLNDRVKLPCAWCGKVFHVHCERDIIQCKDGSRTMVTISFEE